MGDPSVRKCSDSGSCAGRHCLPPRRKGRNGLCSSHPSLFPVFYLEATIELLFKGLSPALVPTPCYQLLSDYMNIKPVEASKTHFLSHCFTVLTLPFFFFLLFCNISVTPNIKTCNTPKWLSPKLWISTIAEAVFQNLNIITRFGCKLWFLLQRKLMEMIRLLL